MRLLDWFFFFWIAPMIALFILYWKLLFWLLLLLIKGIVLLVKGIIAGTKYAITKIKELYQ